MSGIADLLLIKQHCVSFCWTHWTAHVVSSSWQFTRN